MNKFPTWKGRAIASLEDVHDLESRAAVGEFKHRQKREDAEHSAYFQYKQEKLRESAAHHLQGLKAAQAAGSSEEGRKHGLMYQLSMKELGLDPMGPVPHEIKGLADKQEKFYRFRPHKADRLLLQGDDEDEVKKSLRDDVFRLGQRPFVKGQRVYQTSHTGEKFPFTISHPDYKMMRYMDADHPHVYIRPDGWKGSEGWYPLAALHFEDGLAKADGKVLPMKPNTAPAQVQAKPATVMPIAPRQEARKQLARAKVAGILDEAHHAMMSDPGFQELARQREVEAKKAKLKAGGQLFKPGQTVSHVDQQAVPWKGRVVSAAYREDDIDGPGHYYEIRWHNPSLNQYHEDYLHQDNLKPG